MFEADVNYLAVILGALATQLLGFLWYGTLLSGPWVKARGIDVSAEGGQPSPVIYLVPLACALLIAYGFARLVDMVGADDVGDSILLAAFVWAVFAGPVQLIQINFSETKVKRVPTFAIEGGYQLASIVIIGAIVGAFQ